MTTTIKIAVPMAGFGTRMRPHTWSKPKPLVPIAGRTVLDYALDQFKSLPVDWDVEYIFITGEQGKAPIQKHMEKFHPEKKVQYLIQAVMRGQSDALYLARDYLKGPTLMAFSDTLIETDLSFLAAENADGLAWVKPVPDPRRFGVAQVTPEGRVTRLIEKPQDISNNLVIVGFYYFKNGEDLIDAIEEQMRRGTTLKGEYFLADAVNILLERGQIFRTVPVEIWLDAGIPETTLETNGYLLHHGCDNSQRYAGQDGLVVVPPVYIDPSAEVRHAVIGPNVSIGANCKVSEAVIRNSIIGDESTIDQMILTDSLIGDRVILTGQPDRLNVGDNSQITR